MAALWPPNGDGTLRGLFPDCREGPCQLSETFTSELDPSPSAGPSPRRGRWLANLTVATYPVPRAFAALRRSAARNPNGTIRLSGGGLAVVDAGYPKSIHVAYPGVPYQVEVFDPSPARARAIVSSGQVKAVG